MKKIILYVWNILILFLVVITIYVFGQRLAGIQHPQVFDTAFAIVVTGSMEPEIPIYSMVVIQTQDEYATNDIVTYINHNNISVTHRIVDVKHNQIIVKGDVNVFPDPPINKNQIVGKITQVIPIKYVFIVVIILVSIIIGSLVWPENKERYHNVNSKNSIKEKK